MKYGSLYEEMNLKSKSIIVYKLIFMIRRVFVTLNAIFLSDYSLFQVFFTILQSFFMLMFLIKYKVFENNILRNLEIFNELTLLILSYQLLMYSEVC